MENTTIQRMEMTVKIQDVSHKSSYVGYIGFGTWFDGKPFMVAQYQSNPTKWYFFVYDVITVDERWFQSSSDTFSYGRQISELNPANGLVSGSTFTYNSANDTMEQRLGTSEWLVACNPPSFLFEIS
jgi:hypothetical protein